MEHVFGDMETALVRAERVQAEHALVELELGLTFLDIAANTGKPTTNRRCVRNAIVALHTANTFLSVPHCRAKARYISQRRDELRGRLKHALLEKKSYT